MNTSSRDLNLLYVFKVVFESGNLSKAAQRLTLSQPALSHKLNKMRQEYDDPLFVRASRGITPTPKALALAPEILALVDDIESFYQNTQLQSFENVSDTFHLYSTDFVEQLLMPPLLARTQHSAPKVKVITHNTRGQLPRAELETGQCDLAIAGFFKDLPSSYYQQALLEQRFVVLANRNNPMIRGQLDMQGYLRCKHIVTTLTGDLKGLVDAALARQNLKRHVVAGISSFLAPPEIVRNGHYLLTCLENIAYQAANQHEELVVYDCPVALAPVRLVQIWHQRTHSDPLRRWFRAQIQQIMREKSGG